MSLESAQLGVKICDLKVGYGRNFILDGLNLDIEKGEFLVLLGPSGCGKSTLLNAIAGFHDIAEGEIRILDRNVTHAEPKDRRIGMVFQSYALYPRMTVAKNLSFGLRVAGVSKTEIEKRVARAVEILKIGDLLHRRPAELSGGQRQRVAIGRALVRDVDLFLFDEPLSNLDAQLRAELRHEIKKIHHKVDSTMIYVTHDQVEAMTLADRIAIMKNGAIEQLDRPEVIFNRPASVYVAGFLGSPKMNLIKGELITENGAPQFRLPDGHALSLGDYAFTAHEARPGPALLGVRPEHFCLETQADKADFTVTVDMVEYLGSQTIVWAMLGDLSLSIAIDSAVVLSRGADIHLSFDRSRLSLFDAKSTKRL